MASEAQNVMLAEKWTEDIDPSGYYISEKLDGIRAYWSGQTFYTRNGNVLNAPKWFKQGLTSEPLDGELWCGHNQFRKTVSIVRRKEPTDDWKYVKYYVFDAPNVHGPFEKRMQYIQKHLSPSTTPYVVPVGMKVCTGKDQILQELKLVEKAGGEGLMLRKPGSSYVFGRTTTLLKVKNFFDEEAIVLEHEYGKAGGRLSHTMGSLKVKTPDGREFSVGSGFTDKERNKPPKIGAIITYRYQELTSSSNKPRFPVYLGTRIDLDWAAYCKTYKPPTLKTPPPLKLDNSILYSKTHGLENYASFLDGNFPNAAAAAAAAAPAALVSSSSAAAAPDQKDDDESDAPASSHKRKYQKEDEDEGEKEDEDAKPICKYGANCYNKAKEHLQKYLHPSSSPVKKSKPPSAPTPIPEPASKTAEESSTSSDEVDSARRRTLQLTTSSKPTPQYVPVLGETGEDEKEVCVYGVNCYRKNKLHFIQYSHPANHPLLLKGLLKSEIASKTKPASAEEKGKKKVADEEPVKMELVDNLVVPDKLNISLAELTSSEDDSLTWDANSETETDGNASTEKSDQAGSDLGATFIIPTKKEEKKLLEESDETFILPKRNKAPSDLNQTILMDNKSTENQTKTAHVYLIPAAKAKDEEVKPESLSKYKLFTGLNILGRGFDNLEIQDSRISRHHLEALVGAESVPKIKLTLKGLNASSIQREGTDQFEILKVGSPVDIQSGDEIAFLPDLSHRFVFKIF